MATDITYFIAKPWGLALFALMLLAPRMFARSHDPLSLARFGRNRLFRGYFAAIVFALAELPLAALLNLRPWVEAVPVLGAIELINEVPSFKYVFGTLLAWFTAAFLVAPVAAWLNSSARANGLLLLLACLPLAVIAGTPLCLAWNQPLRALPFTLASSMCLVSTVAVGFSVGAQLPFKFRLRSGNAT